MTTDELKRFIELQSCRLSRWTSLQVDLLVSAGSKSGCLHLLPGKSIVIDDLGSLLRLAKTIPGIWSEEISTALHSDDPAESLDKLRNRK